VTAQVMEATANMEHVKLQKDKYQLEKLKMLHDLASSPNSIMKSKKRLVDYLECNM